MMFGVEYDGGVVAMWRGSKMASLLRCSRGSKMASLLRCGWRGGAVVEWWLTKIKKGRRKTLPKDHSHLNHMNSRYTRGQG